MKRNFYFLLMAALVCCLSLSVTSCKDDDKNNDDGDSEEEFTDGPQDGQSEAAAKFWSIMSELADVDEYTNDYKDKTFEPTIGIEDPNNPQARIVYTNNAETAAMRFANLVNIDQAEVTEETTVKEWNDPDVGTLTYTKGDGTTSWATVEVNIKQVPKLEKIIYRAPEQGDENGGVKGGKAAYYRFGDVVSRVVKDKDGKSFDEYWICVRPAFDPEGKGDSHWVSISPLPKANLYTWEYKNVNKKKKINVKRTYVLPTGLGDSEEHMQNFAEMLYAIGNPPAWYHNVQEIKKYFHDFHLKNLEYHNDNFWNRVRVEWYDHDIAWKVFGISENYSKKEAAERLFDILESNSLYFLYKGYSWPAGSGANLTLYQAHYSSGFNVSEKNHHKAEIKKIKKAVYDKNNPANDIEIDVTKLEGGQYTNRNFFGDWDKYYILRVATGAQLSSTKKYPDNTKAIPGVTEVYRYYAVYPNPNKDGKPEIVGDDDDD